MGIQFKENGVILFGDNGIAMSDACCCGCPIGDGGFYYNDFSGQTLDSGWAVGGLVLADGQLVSSSTPSSYVARGAMRAACCPSPGPSFLISNETNCRAISSWPTAMGSGVRLSVAASMYAEVRLWYNGIGTNEVCVIYIYFSNNNSYEMLIHTGEYVSSDEEFWGTVRGEIAGTTTDNLYDINYYYNNNLVGTYQVTRSNIMRGAEIEHGLTTTDNRGGSKFDNYNYVSSY